MEQPSSAVCAFINAYIESIDFLRVLLLLARHPERSSTVGDVSSATSLSAEATSEQLHKIVASGLATAEPDVASTSATFRYLPRVQEFDQMVQELILLDDRKPVTLIRLVYARTSTSAQAFADAFRLRRT